MEQTDTSPARADKTLDAELVALSGGSLPSHVADGQAFIAAVEAGIADLQAGRVVDHATVLAAVRRALRRQS
jgi:predicted transcriptional regulator